MSIIARMPQQNQKIIIKRFLKELAQVSDSRYKQMLREKLQELLDQQGSGSKEGKEALDSMEELERLLLEKGLNEETNNR